MSGISNYQIFTNGGTGMDSFVNSLAKNNNTKGAKADKAGKPAQTVKVGSTSTIAQGIELSDKAKAMMDKLKEKYDNVDFFVANYETDEEAQKYLSQGSKDYSVLLDPETLEKMADDEEEAAKYDDLIAKSIGQLDEMREQLGEDGKDVKSLGVTIDTEGNVKFFAELEKSGERQKEMIEKSRAEKKERAKEEEKADKKKAEKEALAEKLAETADTFAQTKKTTVKADSIEDLINQIKNVDWSKVQATERPMAGSFIDYNV